MPVAVGGHGTETSPYVLDSDSDEEAAVERDEEDEGFQFRVDLSDDNVRFCFCNITGCFRAHPPTLCTLQISDNDEDHSGDSRRGQQAPESHDQDEESRDQLEGPHQEASHPMQSLSSLESEASMGLPEDEASMDIPASSVQLPLRPTSFPKYGMLCM